MTTPALPPGPGAVATAALAPVAVDLTAPDRRGPVSWPRARRIGRVNWIGLGIMARFEVKRWLAWWPESLGAPVLTTGFYYLVFAIALEGLGRTAAAGVPFVMFMVPGLIMMAMMQGAFESGAVSLLMGKMEGTLADYLMPPVAPLELTLGLLAGSLAQGLAIGTLCCLALVPIAGLTLAAPLQIAGFALLGALLTGLLGLLAGLWAVKWDHLAVVGNFAVTPLTFLSGTFFTLDQLPEGWRLAAQVNPFFYLIDGFRGGFLGVSEVPVARAALVLGVLDLVLFALAWWLIRRGYSIKA